MVYMKLNKDDRLLKTALLNDVAGNIATLQGKAKTTINGEKPNDQELISEAIDDLEQLKKLI
ncbi:hypothetical protein FD27_GL001207 [Limosilactobacillus frumenti DSM 13145]|uniref:Uncharacterized protein n=2 Tax=Limosilactobacillus frumenti TaxID=104955 RepID=A0A0R1PBW9_9LACO|nr:hypothetical protein FD27_GL001207 [Limosilactobacillus frumenti DSM 13145]